METKQMHLNAFMMYTPMMHGVGSWAYGRNRIQEGFTDPAFWQGIARTLDTGGFDMVFFGDHLAPYDVYRGGAELSIRYGLQFPVHDPLLLVPFMADATEHLGFGVTLSTAFYPPYLLARKLSTLDHLTSGRVGWNIVTSAQENESRNMGLGHMLPHDERYDRADEYMDVCYALWKSWGDDALIYDGASKALVDTSKVQPATHTGKYFSVNAPSSVYASPQRVPVLLQAGGSPRGRDFAVTHAEEIFSIKRTAADMAKFVDDIESRAAKVGRRRSSLKIVFGAQVIVASSHKEAVDIQQDLLRCVDLDASLAKLSGLIGIDLSSYDYDAPMEKVDAVGAQGLLDIFADSTGPVTIGQAAREYGASGGNLQIVGTPDEVANTMISVFEHGKGDGFNLTPAFLPGAYEDFVETVIPRLRARGFVRQVPSEGILRERVMGRPGATHRG